MVTVLIETLWNVKSRIRCYNVLRCIVLIETLWNVKLKNADILNREIGGINRNIVECKAQIMTAVR